MESDVQEEKIIAKRWNRKTVSVKIIGRRNYPKHGRAKKRISDKELARMTINKRPGQFHPDFTEPEYIQFILKAIQQKGIKASGGGATHWVIETGRIVGANKGKLTSKMLIKMDSVGNIHAQPWS